MLLADRFFAFWRLPAWSDPVQVLLWLMGWALATAFVVALGLSGLMSVFALGDWSGDGGAFFGFVMVFALLMIVGWFVVGSWFISEAYRGWRIGHPHGRQWAFVIAGLLLFNVVAMLLMERQLGPGQAAMFALEAAFGVALLVAALTTKPPSPQPPASA